MHGPSGSFCHCIEMQSWGQLSLHCLAPEVHVHLPSLQPSSHGRCLSHTPLALHLRGALPSHLKSSCEHAISSSSIPSTPSQLNKQPPPDQEHHQQRKKAPEPVLHRAHQKLTSIESRSSPRLTFHDVPADLSRCSPALGRSVRSTIVPATAPALPRSALRARRPRAHAHAPSAQPSRADRGRPGRPVSGRRSYSTPACTAHHERPSPNTAVP